MTRNELYTILQRCGWETTPIHTLDKIWGRAFDGETEKINKEKSVSPTSPIPQTNPVPQKIEWTQQVIADVTTSFVRYDPSYVIPQNTSTTTTEPTQPNQ